jgi:hypothetical protein
MGPLLLDTALRLASAWKKCGESSQAVMIGARFIGGALGEMGPPGEPDATEWNLGSLRSGRKAIGAHEALQPTDCHQQDHGPLPCGWGFLPA